MRKIGDFRPRYSGELSSKFWDLINGLPDPPHATMYLLGCALQDVEHRMLQALTDALQGEREKE